MKYLLLLTVLSPLNCFAQSPADIIRYERLLKDKKYEVLFDECEAALKEPYGKTSHLVSFYLAQSLCRAGYEQNGKEWFRYIKRKLPIDKAFEEELNVASKNCGIESSGSQRNKVTVLISKSYAPAGVSGKGGFEIDCDKAMYENYEKLRTNDSLGKRVFMTHQKEEALRSLRSFLPEEAYKIDTSGRFMVVYDNQFNLFQKDVSAITEELEFAYQFFMRKYALRQIDKLFTIYLVRSHADLRVVASKVHDISISSGNIGYSSLNDLSLLAIAKPGQVGTLFHELFHLMIRSEVGDISPWLDEGMACLYSVYDVEGQELRGSENTWRVFYLKMLLGLRSRTSLTVPSLAQLLNFNWEEYQGGEQTNFCLASVNYALSNIFLLYLQHKGLESEVIRTFKNKSQLVGYPRSPGPDDVTLIEHIFKKDIELISQEFYAWLKERYNIDFLKLVKTRPSYNSSELPESLQPLADSVKIQMTRIDRKVKQSTLKELRVEKARLFSGFDRRFRDFSRKQDEYLKNLSEISQVNAVTPSGYSEYRGDLALYLEIEKDYNNYLSEKESDLAKFISRLKGILAEYQRTGRKI